jgi:hypothetical protein
MFILSPLLFIAPLLYCYFVIAPELSEIQVLTGYPDGGRCKNFLCSLFCYECVELQKWRAVNTWREQGGVPVQPLQPVPAGQVQ